MADCRVVKAALVLAVTDVGGSGMLRLKVLNERAAKRDVDDLDTTADSQDGQIRGHGDAEEVKLEVVTLGVNAVRCLMDVLITVTERIDVRTATEQDAVDDLGERFDVSLWGKYERNATGRFDRANVRRG